VGQWYTRQQTLWLARHGNTAQHNTAPLQHCTTQDKRQGKTTQHNNKTQHKTTQENTTPRQTQDTPSKTNTPTKNKAQESPKTRTREVKKKQKP
jgi:hypothetical protein